jgi:hypothetical protein
MKKIRIWADTHSTGIFDSKGEFYSKNETTILDKTWNKLQQWVEDYDYIIPMDEVEREKHQREIVELDTRGKELMKEIEAEWNTDVKTGEDLYFVYYSEGLMKELP